MKRLPLAITIMASLSACTSISFSSSEHIKSVASIGADGWATAENSVTGGEGAAADHIYTVTNRKELIEALYGSRDANINTNPSNEKKIIYIKGKIDLSANEKDNKSMTAEDFMAQCELYGYNDYDTFYQAYRNEFNPHTWNKQSLASNGRPPVVSGQLEDARDCYQKAQASYTVLRVGSNTSILGLGNNAELSFGTLLLGKNGEESVSNIVIRNIEFKDAFDFFPSWSPTDSFKIDKNEFGVGNCSNVYVSDEVNPAACESIEGGRWNSEYDLISVDNAHRIWIDHNTFSDGKRTDDNYPPVFAAPYNAKEQKVQHHDGLVDVTNGATQVTMSYNHFKNHDKTNLLGGSDTTNEERSYGPGSIDVTFHHNYWQDTGQRMPRVRFGRVHVYNNFFQLDASSTPAPTYRMGNAIILGTASKIVVENNAFEIKGEDFAKKIIGFSSSQSNRNKCEKTQRYEAGACATYFYAQGNIVNGQDMDLNDMAKIKAKSSTSNSLLTILLSNSESEFWLPRYSYEYQLQPAQEVKNDVMRNAGAGKLKFK